MKLLRNQKLSGKTQWKQRWTAGRGSVHLPVGNRKLKSRDVCVSLCVELKLKLTFLLLTGWNGTPET